MDKYLGKRLDGRYEMRELIGVGGMAYVYKAYDAVDDRIVAVKILKDEFLNSDEFVRRFRNESKAIAILNHPNIVKVLDVGFGERLQYIVMEYIDGITLKEYLDQRKDIRWKEAVHFTVQILRALQHAHDKGIVHRDIKPQNIMLLSDGTIKVTDFGIARLTRSDMKATVEGNKAIGSVHYISPEQARGEITDEKTDLYAVGIMLYEMLTGCLPFEADNAVSVAIMQMQSEAKAPHLINAEIPEGLEQITLKAMQKDTAKRYQSAAEMLSDFDEFKKNPSIKFEYTYMVDDTPTRYVDAITRVRGESPEPAAKTSKDEPAKAQKTNPKKMNTKTIVLIVILCLVAALLIFMIVSIGGAIGGKSNWISKIFGGLNFSKKADEVVVDKFIGQMYYTDIEGNTEYTQKFELKIKWEDANDPDVKKGEVYKQEPAYGKTVKRGATVTLYVNMATPKDITLDVRAEIEGAHKNDVRKLLQDAGFEVNEIVSSSEQVPADHVISINVNKGQTYPYGTKVTMVVSTGPSTLEPIPLDQDLPIIGESKETVAKTLEALGFVGSIVPVDTCYTDERFAQKGIVMGVIIDGVMQETLPTEIKADGVLTLAVSNGLKGVVVELDWPMNENGSYVNMSLNVSVLVNGVPQAALTEQYNNPSYNPSFNSSKLTFVLNSHPSEADYYVGVNLKNGSSGSEKEYVRLLINPTAGTWAMVDGYQPISGITPDVTVPDVVGQTLSYDTLVNEYLKHFNVTVVDSATNVAVIDGDNWKIDRIMNGSVVVASGSSLPMYTKLTVKVSVVEMSTDAEIPADIFYGTISLDALDSALAEFVFTVKDSAGEIVTAADGVQVTNVVYLGNEMAAGALVPVGAEIEVFVNVFMLVPADMVGQSGDVAVARLTELGFVVEVRGANGEENPTGSVVQITTTDGANASGNLYSEGTALIITVA